MNSPYHSDSNLQELNDSDDREISLGTSTVLGIFFALALVCALFFGFGYSMGRRSAQSGPTSIQTASGPASSSSTKPLSGTSATPTPSSTNTAQPAPDATESRNSPTEQSPTDKPAEAATPAAASVAPLTASKPTPTPPVSTATGSFVVQIAAVSHKQDADILVSALQRRGYDVAIHQEPQDKLLHVQVGPFTAKKDADAMRLRLLADGYNAIVK